MSKKLTTKDFKEKILKKYGNDFIVLGEYINTHEKILMKHIPCNTERLIEPNNLLRNRIYRCPVCFGNVQKTTEEFAKEIKETTNGEYELVSEYINNKTKLKILHKKCNLIYEVRPYEFVAGNRCPDCSKKEMHLNHRKTTDWFIEQVKIKLGIDYTVIGNYITTETPIKMKHLICNKEYETTPHVILNGHGCPYCFGNIAYTTKTFKEKIFELVGNDYTVLEEYKNSQTRIKIKHEECNKIWNYLPNSFINKNTRCPYCTKTSYLGEERIAKWLEENECDYIKQHEFPDCRNINPLKFDFKLEDINEHGKLNKIILIEYDGIQHYEPIYGESKFLAQQRNDKIKNDYCNSHDNIDLYRIPYWDFDNIETILEDIISKYNN